ncbi:MAG: bifunctional demethylmenaquinone methyltransferase/2-methoxy-6-polyprenyl-1,4-benzoquinol methylase UbiE [Synechococcales bacterium]|nr:bifunctional demethylmenaquinone methyltransferase/2-methoxy-6-polyprenyl-1,4-benzoquinol methylase UbiE [Synechococcales bacterium]
MSPSASSYEASGDRPSPSQQAQQVRSLFNQIAPAYDELNGWLSLGLHRVWKQMAVSWSRPYPGATVLDVCCGSGDLARLLARQVGATGQVFGLDFAEAQLAIARQLSTHRGNVAPITWVEGDALDLPFADHQFDAATMGYGLRNVVDIPQSLGELHRVLKPGATVAILDFHRPANLPMQQFQAWYLNQVVVPLAAQFGLREEYAYISTSLERFPTGTQQVAQARAAGFDSATHYAIAGGMMGVLVASKQLS